MTEFNDDKPETQGNKGFKEQILKELEAANLSRVEREEELFQEELKAKEITRRTAKLIAEYEAQDSKDFQSSSILDEQNRSGTDSQKKISVDQQATLDDKSVIDSTIENSSALLSREKDNNQKNVPIQDSSSTINSVQDSFLGASAESVSYDDTPNISEIKNDEVTIGTRLENPAQNSNRKSLEKDKVRKKSNRGRRRQKTDNLAKRIALILISAILILLLATGFFGYRYVSSAVGPLNAKSTDYVTVEIPSGSGNSYIGQILEEAGVIKSATVFNYYTKFKNFSNLQSGYYNLQSSMNLEKICELLQAGGTAEPEKPALGKILVPEGYTIKQIAEAVSTNSTAETNDKSTPFSADDFLALVQDDSFIARMIEKYPNLLSGLPSSEDAIYRLEGYLFPATYSYYADTTLESLVEQMIATMDSYMSNYYSAISSKNLTVNEVLTIASLVEKEGATDDDRRNIASVFYNRLNIGMALQSNIAILYAMGTLGQETTLSQDANVDTSIDSPYNVYVNTGLMPGPVDSPSLSAIEATINPASTDYYYFVADVKTGTVYYSETYEEHAANVEQYVNSQLTE